MDSTANLNIRVTNGMAGQLDSLAERAGCDRTKLVRWLIADGLIEQRYPRDWALIAEAEREPVGV